MHKLCKYASELEQSRGRRGRVEVDGVRGSQRWTEKGKGGHTMTAAPDQKVALLVIPGWANAVPALLVLLVLWSPQEPKQSLLMAIQAHHGAVTVQP